MKYFMSIIITFTLIGCGSSNSVSKDSSTTPPQPKVIQSDAKPPASPNIE